MQQNVIQPVTVDGTHIALGGDGKRHAYHVPTSRGVVVIAMGVGYQPIDQLLEEWKQENQPRVAPNLVVNVLPGLIVYNSLRHRIGFNCPGCDTPVSSIRDRRRVQTTDGERSVLVCYFCEEKLQTI